MRLGNYFDFQKDPWCEMEQTGDIAVRVTAIQR